MPPTYCGNRTRIKGLSLRLHVLYPALPLSHGYVQYHLRNFYKLYRDGLQYNLTLFKWYGGVIKAEQLLVHDPLAIQHILARDQDAFEEADMFVEANRLLFGEGLIATVGAQHKKQRKLLTPVFSLTNLRSILPRLQHVANELSTKLQADLPSGGGTQEIDILRWLSRGTLEYVSRGILGVDLDFMDAEKTNEYANAICNVQLAPFPALRELRDIAAELMHRSAKDIFIAKKAEVKEMGTDAKSSGDLMSILFRAKSSTQDKLRLTEDELIGQITTFMLGGQETTTSALARLLHILAQEQEAQTRLCSEIRKAKLAQATAQGESELSNWQHINLPYDVLMGLPYLDAVVRETLRLFPPTSMMNRTMTFFGGSRACIGFKFAEMEIKQILATLLSTMHFTLPTAEDVEGKRKKIYWRMDGLQVPVILPPCGDPKTAQVPLNIRLAKGGDFL
ncbi:hypothetical protein ONZ51_g1254 [Trametes cubensis]|uniref:Cytochrome P450 n=1 Tax=Trametes cubensis TaxID=1111947 RepID=A0AAD7U2H2_9APHY|nr:hypothetical protein ONZ51_g1254 [Trametes cubensis]